MRDPVCAPRVVSVPSLHILRRLNPKGQPAYVLNLLPCTTQNPGLPLTLDQKENNIQIKVHITAISKLCHIWLSMICLEGLIQIPEGISLFLATDPVRNENRTNETCRIMQ